MFLAMCVLTLCLWTAADPQWLAQTPVAVLRAEPREVAHEQTRCLLTGHAQGCWWW